VVPNPYLGHFGPPNTAGGTGNLDSEPRARPGSPDGVDYEARRKLHGPCLHRGPEGIECIKQVRHYGRHMGYLRDELMSWRPDDDPTEIRGGWET
jgi:hypothetical protein